MQGDIQLAAGSFNRRVTFMSPNATPDATGFVPRDAMTPVRTVWASVEPTTGKELRNAMREVSDSLVTIRCRYLAAKDVIASWWIQQTTDQGTVLYDIVNISHVGQARKIIELTCKVVN